VNQGWERMMKYRAGGKRRTQAGRLCHRDHQGKDTQAGRLCHRNQFEALEARQLLAFDPTASEQYMLELTNRMRLNPAAELGLLTSSLGDPARSFDSDVDGAMRFFNTSGTLLQQQWGSLTPAPALAWNANLYAAAEGHNGQMIAFDEQSHQLPGEPGLGQRANNAGYTGWSSLGESVYAFARSVFHGHAGFAIDWGNDTGGIQDPPGHRESMMNPAFREVGIRVQDIGVVAGRSVGPLVISQEFGRRSGNTFLLGVVYGDTTNDGYSVGEGYGGVTITISSALPGTGSQTITTSSMSAGGWQVQIAPGTYNVTFAGAGFGNAVTYRDVVVGSNNVKLDAKRGVVPPEPDIQVWANGVYIASGDTTPSVNDFTAFGQTERDSETVTREFSIYNGGARALNLTSIPRVKVTGANAGDFTIVQTVGGSVQPGASAVFAIQFNPSATGMRTATVTIQSNDADTPLYSFKLQGRGVLKPNIAVVGNGSTIPSGDTTPRTLDFTGFGGADAQGGFKDRVFTIQNTGSNTLRLKSAITFSGSDAFSFSIVGAPVNVLLPGESTEVTVRFTPQAVGIAKAVMTIPSNDPDTPGYMFAIRGNGVGYGRLRVLGGPVTNINIPIARDDSTPSLVDKTDFGVVATGGKRVRQFLIQNTGLGVLKLTGVPRVVLSGSGAGAFSVNFQPPLVQLAPGQMMVFRVRFTATDSGQQDAVVSIASNDTNGVYSFAISGVGA
jgi:hypothetical protein